MNNRKTLLAGVLAAALTIPTAGIAIAHVRDDAANPIPAATQSSQGMGQGQGGGQGQGMGQHQGAGMGQGRGQGRGAGQGADGTDAPSEALDPELATALIYLAEEEKVAHDLYLLAHDLYGTQTFANIANSETRHFTAMNGRLSAYDQPSESAMGTPGTFVDADLQATYDTLAERVRESAEEAAAVGVLVEETDISDLNAALDQNPPADVTRVLQNLVRASGHHLSAFEALQG